MVEEKFMVTPDHTVILFPVEIVIVSVLVKLIDSPEVKVIVSDCNGCSPLYVGFGCTSDETLAVIGARELENRRTIKKAAITLALSLFFPLIFISFPILV